MLNALRQKKLIAFNSLVVPCKWKAHTIDKCEVSEEQIITGMITFRFASILRCGERWYEEKKVTKHTAKCQVNHYSHYLHILGTLYQF